MKRTRITVVALVLVLVAIAALTGCKAKKEQAKVTSSWPKANAERTVTKPKQLPVWPYTGLPATDETAVTHRPLSIKIENSPNARPQTGLNSTDVIYESITEGGITRFNCIFQSNTPPKVGPVRSARLSDLWIVPQYDGLFFFSGASSTVNGAIRRAKLPNLSEDAGVSAPYERSSARPAPHNLYLNTAKAYPTAEKRGMRITSNAVPLLFDAAPATESTEVISQVTIPFSQANTAQWTWDPAQQVYLRATNGKVHADAATGKQVRAKNVVVLWVKYTARSHDKVGSTTYDVNLGGTGQAAIFRDGHRIDGTWTATKTSPPRFRRADGTAIKLAPGNTWFQVIPLDGKITMK
jgi:hypothetical protein